MTHGDTVAYGRSSENERDSPCLADTLFDGIHDLVQMYVSGNYLVPGIGDPDERLVEVFVLETVCPEQTPCRCRIDTVLYDVASHV